MSTLAEIEATLRRNIKESRPLLDGVEAGAVGELLALLPDAVPLRVAGGVVARDTRGLRVRGKCPVLGLRNVPVELRVGEPDGVRLLTLEAKLPSRSALTVPGLKDLAIANVALTVTNRRVSGGLGAVDILGAQLSGTIRLKGAELGVAVRLPAGDQKYWTITGEFGRTALPDLGQLARLAGGGELLDALPLEVAALGGFAITGLECALDPESASVVSVRVSIETPKKLDLVPGAVSLTGLGLVLAVTHPGDASRRMATGTLGGTLRLGGTTLALAAELSAMRFSGTLAEGSRVSLTAAVSALLPAGFALPPGVPDITLSRLSLTADGRAKSLSLFATAQAEWEAVPGVLTLRNIEAEFNRSAAATEAILTGTAVLAGSEVAVTGRFGPEFSLTGSVDRLSLGRIAAELLDRLSLPADIPDVEFADVEITVVPAQKALTLTGRSLTEWNLPIGVGSLRISDLGVELSRSRAANNRTVARAVLSGTLELGTARLTVTTELGPTPVFTGKLSSVVLSSLLQDLCGGELFRQLAIPPKVATLALTDVELSIAPAAGTMSLVGNTSQGLIEVQVKKGADRKWGFAVGIVPPAGWKPSQLAAELGALDVLNFSNTALVLASADDRTLVLTRLPGAQVEVRRGLNLVASLDVTGKGVDQLLKVNSLDVRASLGPRLGDTMVEAGIKGSMQLAENVVFDRIAFQLTPAPGNFSIALAGTLLVQVKDASLEFTGAMKVEPRRAVLAATMEGIWKEPLGTRGVAMGNVALELGVTFPPPLPSFALAGSLRIGSVDGKAALKFDAATPTKSMVAVEFNRLMLREIVQSCCAPSIYRSVPEAAWNGPLNLGFENAKVYIVPQPTTIGTLHFEQGFTVQGTVVIWGLRGALRVNIDHGVGVTVSGEVDPIDLGGIFKLQGAGGHAKPTVYIEAGTRKAPNIDIAAAVELLGLRSEVVIVLNERGFYFKAQQRLFNVFQCTLEVRGRDFLSAGEFSVKAVFQSDLARFIEKDVTAALRAAADDATRAIGNAQKAVADAGSKVRLLGGEIEKQRRIVRAERERDARRLRDAQAAVTGAQREVDKLQGNINSAKARIAQLEREIQSKRRWYNNLRWWDKTWGWTELAAYEVAKNTEIGAQYTAIGALEASKGIAIGVLEGAKQVVRAIELAAVTIPVDADPRVWGLIAARETALQGLAVANGALEIAKQSVKGGAMIAEAAARSAATLFVVHQASFEASLGAARGGVVSTAFDLTLLGSRKQMSFALNFRDPASSARDIAVSLVRSIA